MNPVLLAATVGMLAAPLSAQRVDTTFAMPANGRLDLNSARGTVTIARWSKAEVRVEANHRGADTVSIKRAGSVVSIVASSHRDADRFQAGMDTSKIVIRTTKPKSIAPPALIDYVITVPLGFAVVVSGNAVDVSADGGNGPLDIATISGLTHIVNVTGAMQLQTVNGRIEVEKGAGRAFARSLRGSIAVRDFAGDVDAQVFGGALELAGITGSHLRGVSVAGPIDFTGPLSANGRYSLSTQRGAITITLLKPSNATVDIAARRAPAVCEGIAEGTAPSKSWRRFVLGSGNALIDVDSFDGTVRLCDERRSGDKE